MTNVYWKPWIEETRQVINRWCRYLFAALVLTFLFLANLAAILVIVANMKKIVG